MRLSNRLRAFLMASAMVPVCACLDTLGAPDPHLPGRSTAIWTENQKPASAGWDYGPNGVADSDSLLGGYGLPLSLTSGDTLHLFVMARRPPLSTAIYRLGWYGGDGGRLVAKHIGIRAADQAPCTPPAAGPIVCNWTETDGFIVGAEWFPGVYLAEFKDAAGSTRSFPFVVRSSVHAAFTVILPFATYQAYNRWGGASLYGGPGATRQEAYANRSVKVTFARPFSEVVVQNHFLGIDYLLVRWLEQNAYDVNYITDIDFHSGSGVDPAAVGWLFAGHSEYWTWSMWQRANAARDQGMNLGFLGGNDIYWLSRFETVSVDGQEAPVVVCYRDASRDPLGTVPGMATVLFRSPPNNAPENALVGVMSSPPTQVKGSPVDLVVADTANPLMAGTGLTLGEHIPHVAGWEADRTVANGYTPPGTQVLFQSPFVSATDSVTPGVMEATVYRWEPSGALVYASGEPGFAWGLETFRNRTARQPLQRLLANVIQAFIDNKSNTR